MNEMLDNWTVELMHGLGQGGVGVLLCARGVWILLSCLEHVAGYFCTQKHDSAQ